MEWFNAPEYWLGRLVLERGIAAVYLIAFVVAARQFRALIGAHGMLPIPRFLAEQSFWQAPSIFHLHYSDRLFATISWFGAALSAAIVGGVADVVPLWTAMLMWLVLWVLYLSIVNVGQTWYSFGWESLLLEAGFLGIFLGNDRIAPPLVVIWLARWLLFRVEFGAGLIKLRGDSCWRDLTCLDYHHETQPMPGPLSWFFHHLPKPLHRIEVAGNHFAQLVVPFGLFAPQPVASAAAVIMIITQLWLVLSGNFAWLNWLTIILGFSAIDASSAAAVLPLPEQPAPSAPPAW
ncbi:lipase maturation factor family protein, partial [Mycobacterium sp.]|uniref:lipase maturation factor family protein n=1 Tax=Mycobacterium sp. TaxID=1785 RepID=UPI002D5CB84E